MHSFPSIHSFFVQIITGIPSFKHSCTHSFFHSSINAIIFVHAVIHSFIHGRLSPFHTQEALTCDVSLPTFPRDANMQQLMKLQDDLVQELNDMKSDMAKLAARNKALGEEKTRLERSCLEQQASTGERQSLASHCQTLEEDNVRLQQEMRAFTEIWQREKEDYESKLLSFAEYQKNAQVFRKEHEDLEKKVNGFANLAYAWENEKKAYETKVAELSRRPTLLQVVQNCSFRLFVVVCAHD